MSSEAGRLTEALTCAQARWTRGSRLQQKASTPLPCRSWPSCSWSPASAGASQQLLGPLAASLPDSWVMPLQRVSAAVHAASGAAGAPAPRSDDRACPARCWSGCVHRLLQPAEWTVRRGSELVHNVPEAIFAIAPDPAKLERWAQTRWEVGELMCKHAAAVCCLSGLPDEHICHAGAAKLPVGGRAQARACAQATGAAGCRASGGGRA